MAAHRISDRRERLLVAAADTLSRPIAAIRRLRRPAVEGRPARILCFRLERIGDLLMTLPALSELRAALPDASIDLVVGSWNRDIAALIPGIDRVETLDAAWLTRPSTGSGRPEHVEGRGGNGLRAMALIRGAAAWRPRGYDLAINFEPDIRTNLALAAAGARRTAGFVSGGGGAFLDCALEFEPLAHTAANGVRLIRTLLSLDEGPIPAGRLAIPDALRAEATRLLHPLGDAVKIGMHVSGGRAIKQWPEERFRDVAAALVRDRSATIVLTGTLADRSPIAIVRDALPPNRVLDLSEGASLPTVAAVLQQLDLLVTGDTGPMHLAAAVGTPVVAVFGPSDPVRYAPPGLRDHVVRVDLPCSPCNRIRRPPARCVGHTPDCLAHVETAAVLGAIDEVLGGRT